jgi:quercetin dioxygenase-like cupin family protein
MYVVSRDDLPSGNFSDNFVGQDHLGVGVSMILIDAEPGQGPSLHTHPYPEIHVIEDGEATFVADGEERVVRAGEIVVVPAGVPHSFVNGGDSTFRELAIHVSPTFETTWLAND